jgi:hypothetical protein
MEVYMSEFESFLCQAVEEVNSSCANASDQSDLVLAAYNTNSMEGQKLKMIAWDNQQK